MMHESDKRLSETSIPVDLQASHQRRSAEAARINSARILENFNLLSMKAPPPAPGFPAHRIELKLQGEGRNAKVKLKLQNGNYLESRTMPRQTTPESRTLLDEIERRRAAEDQLCESEKSFRLALDASFNGVWDLNFATGEINFGENWYRSLGYEKYSEVSDSHLWQKLIHPDDLEKILAMHSALAQGINPHYELEYRIKNAAGNWRWILSRGRILTRDEKGRVLRIIGIDTDVTRLKQAEAELQAAKAELETQIMEKTAELHTTHIALEVLLRKREADKSSLEGCVMSNIDKLIEPFLARLEESRLNEQQKLLIEILRNNIKDLTSPFANTFTARLTRLTPSEIQIANLVKLGKRTKEIARIMNLSEGTISIHRKNIRKKLRLTHQKTNLQSALSAHL
ncbi:MAG: PAS domain S-box protein [Desulfobulbaceae bacterium]|nr:MAG: PAS domain S-box protein [Desulfobulbaceae bacterium]